MRDFLFQNKTELHFGKGKELLIGEQIKRLGAKKAVVCYGQGSVVRSGLLGKIKDSLTDAGVEFVEYGGICANPSKTHAIEGIKFAKANNVDFVVAVGGGSVIDEAKCIAVGVKNEFFWDFYATKSDKGLFDALPLAVVLTLPAAGSESSTSTVIRDEKTGRKYSFNSELVRPKMAFINPEICYTVPKHQIANGASDILAHLMERFFSPQENVVVTDKLLTGAMQAVLEVSPKLLNDNTNYQLWSEFCLIGTLAHNGMLNMGRDLQDWASHMIEMAFLSGMNNIAHGAGLAIIFPAWLKQVSAKKPKKILQFAKDVLEADGDTDQQIISNGISKLEDFYTSLGLSVTLSGIGIDYKEILKSVPNVYNQQTSLGTYGELNISDIEQIVRFAK